MEACVVICRMNKPKARKGKVLFINAVGEVTRERAQSFLTDDHIERIVNAYRNFTNEDGFTTVADILSIRNQEHNLSIPLYVRARAASQLTATYDILDGKMELTKATREWKQGSQSLRTSMDDLFDVLNNTNFN